MLAHGAVLRKNFFNADQLIAIVKDYSHASLTDEEVTLMALAQKIVVDPKQVTQEDIADLRICGLTDADILDVVLVCTARTFFSKTLDALGVEPDEAYKSLEPELVKALTIGRVF